MSDLSKKPPTNYSPVYAAALYPELAQITRERGWALAVHGSMARDFDLVAVPWIAEPLPHAEVVKYILSKYAIKQVGECEVREHGRVVYSLSIGFGHCAIDLSFMPTIQA